MSFTSVFIPSSTEDMKEQVYSKKGGLQKDSLRLFAESYFSVPLEDRKSLLDSQTKDINEMLLKQGLDPSKVSPDLYNNISNAGGVEIISLSLPTASNGFIGVSMYCDRNGKFKQLPINTRATSLAKACANDLIVYGDAFIGRCLDDESKEWTRLNFDLKDMNSDAEWVIEANIKNNGKNMNKFSTSGTLENIMKQNNTSIVTGSSTIESEKVIDNFDGNVSYTQANDEIEIKITLKINIKKSDVNVIIKSKSLQLINKSNNLESLFHKEATGELDMKIINVNELPLWSNVDVSSSTWTLEKYKNEYNILIISLSKAKEGLKWPNLIKE